jgi:CRP/FNR family transcriptional regulator, anaerobic regulatory protein
LSEKHTIDFRALAASGVDKHRVGQSLRVQFFKKGEAIFKSGEVCTNVYLIRSGLVKLSYWTRDGKELIKSFIDEGGIFGSLYSQLTGKGSTYSAIALEDVEIDTLSYSILETLCRDNPDFQSALLGFFQQLALSKEIREYEFLCLSAQERYQNFCTYNLDLAKRIKQVDMALYLGITPVALSRLKHRKTSGIRSK